MAEFDLSRYSTVPLYNTKAVVRETGISASTLRAWERRYGVPAPTRTGNNYRLYSEYDIALIGWLRGQIHDGLSISQAVQLYRHMNPAERTISFVEQNPPQPPTDFKHLADGKPIAEGQQIAEASQLYDADSCQQRLIRAFKRFDQEAGDQLIGELFARFPLEHVLTQIIEPAMVELGEQWHAGLLPIPVEHFATAYIKRKIMSLINAQATHPTAPIVVTGCAPHEQHELGVLFLSLFLQRNGLRVIYLGQNVPPEDLRASLNNIKPAMVALSAMTEENALKLRPISQMIAQLPLPRPIFAFGGRAFSQNPTLTEQLMGITLGNDAVTAARQAVEHIRRNRYVEHLG